MMRGEPTDHSNPHFQSLVSQVLNINDMMMSMLDADCWSMHHISSWIKMDSDDGAADARVRPSLWTSWRLAPPPLPPAS